MLRLPLAPACRPRESRIPTSLGSMYWRLADSTCSLASLVLPALRNISRIRLVRSITEASISFCRFFNWEGERASSKIT